MKSWLKRIRGAIGVGLTWAVGWGLSMGLWWLVGTWADFGLDVATRFALQYAAAGFVGGVTFSVALRLTEGRRRFDELRIPKFAAWGAFGGFLIGAGYSAVLAVLAGTEVAPSILAFGEFVAITTVLGAGSAAGSLAIARAADDRQLLEEGAESAEVGLSGEEQRQLLGHPDPIGN